MARKVNTKFILIVTLIVGFAMVAGGGAVWYRKRHRDPKQLLAVAVDSEQKGDYLTAYKHYLAAGQIMRDPKVLTKAGDVMYKISYDDDQNMRTAYACWEAAIGTDPTYTPALERELNYLQECRIIPGDRPSPALYDNIQTVAKKILKVDPKNLAARAAIPIAIIDSWVHQIVTDQTQIDKAVKDLVDLQKDDPTNPEIPFYIAAAYATQGAAAQTNANPADAEKYNAQASAVIEEALKNNDSSGKLHYRAAQIYLSEATPLGDEAKFSAKREKAREQAMKAVELIKPTDPEFDEVVSLAATLARDPDSLKKYPTGADRDAESTQKDFAAQEKIYRDALKAKPDDIPSRLHLAELIGQRYDRRDEAIELLQSMPEPGTEDRSGPRALQLKNVQAQALSSLTNYRLDKLTTLKSKSEQDALMAQIESDYHKLEVHAPDNPFILRLKAKIQIAKGQVTDAVATLTQAIPKTDVRNPMRYELMYLSAKCYLATNQTGSAKAYLEDIVKNIPKYDEARILLTETQLKEFDFKDAEPNLDLLEKSSPGDMRVIRMRIACLQQEKKLDEAKAVYKRLPETNRNQKLDKATIAFLMNQPDEAKRLMESVLSADPGDVDASLMLANFYSRNKDVANATAVLDRALKAKPGNPDLQMARVQATGGSAQELKQIRLAEAAKIADPLEKELTLLDLTRDESDENIPLGHLKAAEKINPNDPRVINAMFEYHLAHHNWDQASPYLERLATLNADKVKGTLLRWRMAMARAESEQDTKRRSEALVKALDLATQLTHDYPEFAQSWLCVGETNTALGRYEEALPGFNSAIEKQPQNADAYRGLIECYYQLNRPTEASKVIDQAVQTLPGVPVFKEIKLQHELNYGRPENVIAAREQAVKDNPESPQALMSLAQAYASVARAKSAKGSSDAEANGWLEKAKASLAQGADKFPGELQFVITHGAICQMLKENDQGEKLWKTAIARDQWKNNPQAINAFADFYVRCNRVDDAEKLLADFLATPAGKNDVDITSKLSDLYASQKKFDEAIKLVDTMPDDPQLRLKKIDLLVNQGKLADAEALITTVMQKNKTPELTTALAYIYLNSNRVQQSLDLLNQVLAERPGMPNALFFHAMATLRLPNPKLDDAISDLVQVREDMPQNLAARYLLVDCLEHTKDLDSAAKELEGILKIAPGQKMARMKLIELYSNDNPPRWLDAERVARDGDATPEIANDPEFLAAEARLYSKRGDADHAIRCITSAMKLQPENLGLTRTYYGVLETGKKYQDLLSETDKLSKENQALWWVHSFRGSAKCKLGDRTGGLQEFLDAMNATFAAKDETAGRVVVDQMVDAAGADAALKMVMGLPQASEPKWLLTTAFLQQKKGDIPAARKTIEQVLTNLQKLSPEEQQVALSFAGSVYMQDPEPNNDRAREIYLQLLKVTPNDFAIYNNLACNRSVSAPDALQYGKKAYDLMQQQHTFEPLVADTYGWALVQSGDERNLDAGLNVLLDAWNARHVVDIAYHLGEAYLRKNNGIEADKYLTQAQALFTDALNNKEQLDVTLQKSIVAAQDKADKLKSRK